MNRRHLLGAAAVTASALVLARSWMVVHAQEAARRPEAPGVAPPQPGAVSVPFVRDGNFQIRSVYPVTTANPAFVYGFALSENDPEMGELAQVEARASQESAELLSHYAASNDAAEQKELKAKLRLALEDQFRVQMKRQQLELTRIEERIKKLREQFKKRNDTRETIIDRRLDQLINEAEGLGWAPSSAEAPQSAFWSSGAGRPPQALPVPKGGTVIRGN